MKDLKKAFCAPDASVVITGDSISYNRYDYVDEPIMDAWDCPPEVRSWSFCLRDLVPSGKAYLTGRGSTTAGFLLENFEERIARYNPTMLIIVTGGNDRILISKEQHAAELDELLTRLKDCAVLILMNPNSENPENPESDESPYTSLKTAGIFRDVAIDACNKHNVEYLDITELFAEIPIEKWRFDSIHLNKFGNEILLNHLKEKLLQA